MILDFFFVFLNNRYNIKQMIKNKHIFFFKVKIKGLLYVFRQNKILNYYFSLYLSEIILHQSFLELNIKLQLISKKTICNFLKKKYKNNNVNISINYITLKDLNIFLFKLFFEKFGIFTVIKKISKNNFKKLKKKFRIFFNTIL
jgi:hypothetical protein